MKTEKKKKKERKVDEIRNITGISIAISNSFRVTYSSINPHLFCTLESMTNMRWQGFIVTKQEREKKGGFGFN
jgi:hypothetical protein